MAGTITGSSAIVMLSIPGLFTQPQQLQGFDMDDVFDTDQIASVETKMGVDGRLSGGFVALEAWGGPRQAAAGGRGADLLRLLVLYLRSEAGMRPKWRRRLIID